MSQSLLIADACVIMDHGYIDGLKWLTQLGRIEVLDVVLAECHHPKQPGLVAAAKAAGIVEVEAADQYVREAASCPYRELSPVDSLLLYYSKGEHRTLLTNEEPMRLACGREGVEVHGTLWLIRQYSENSIADKKALCSALDGLVQQDRRTSMKLVNELRDVLGCNKTQNA
jgi:hypothetical protein